MVACQSRLIRRHCRAMGYPGGKAGPGVYQRLINEIPPHDVYVAGFAGRDAIAQFKKPALRNILIDLDPTPLDWWSEYSSGADGTGDAGLWELHNCCSLDWLRFNFGLTRHHRTANLPPGDRESRYQNWFVFLDPPYLMETRSSGPFYRYELPDEKHQELLQIVQLIPCPVMLCGYWSELYARDLRDWRVVEYFSVCRSGEKRKEYAWCNFPKPQVLHDARFVGGDKRERENLRRRITRLSRTLAVLPDYERQAVLDSLLDTKPTHRPTLAAASSCFSAGRPTVDRPTTDP